MLRIERLRDPSRRPLLVVVTDGRATSAGGLGGDARELAGRGARLLAAEGVTSVVVDCESGPVRLGLAGVLAADLGGPAVSLDGLRADSLAGLVKNVRTSVESARSPQGAGNRRAA